MWMEFSSQYSILNMGSFSMSWSQSSHSSPEQQTFLHPSSSWETLTQSPDGRTFHHILCCILPLNPESYTSPMSVTGPNSALKGQTDRLSILFLAPGKCSCNMGERLRNKGTPVLGAQKEFWQTWLPSPVISAIMMNTFFCPPSLLFSSLLFPFSLLPLSITPLCLLSLLSLVYSSFSFLLSSISSPSSPIWPYFLIPKLGSETVPNSRMLWGLREAMHAKNF